MNWPSPLFPITCTLLICQTLFSCNESRTDGPSPEGAELDRSELAYEDLVKVNAAARLNQLGDSVFELAEYPAAIAFYQRSLDSAAAQADSFLYYDSRLDLACVYDRIGEQQKAVEIAEPVVDAFIRGGRFRTHRARLHNACRFLQQTQAAGQKP